ncbi:MAG: DUF3313 domain-containing protein [Pseudomonadota bacterium]|nr:DUF3313 domain-containing protein [Pseudomonadota bacterium]
MDRVKYYSLLAIITLFLISLLGCAAGNQANSGFLGDAAMYHKLAPNKRALDKTWVAPDADLKKYKKIMLDQVVFYIHKDAENRAIAPENVKELADAFHEAFVKELNPAYPLVADPGPDVLRIKIAIVDIEPSSRTLDSITTIIPVGVAISLVKQGVTGAGTGVGRASMEAIFIDSQSNSVIALAKDQEIGSKLDLAAKTDEWGHAKTAFTYWATSLKKALDDIAAGTFPKSSTVDQ